MAPGRRLRDSSRDTGSTASRPSGFSLMGPCIQGNQDPRTSPTNPRVQWGPLPRIICITYATISPIYCSEPSTNSYSSPKLVERTRLGLGMASRLPDEAHVSLWQLSSHLPRPPKASLTAGSTCSRGRVMQSRTPSFLIETETGCTISATRVGRNTVSGHRRYGSGYLEEANSGM